MRVAGAMRWPPDRFWSSTPREFRLAMEGWLMSRGVRIETQAQREARSTRLRRLRSYMSQYCRNDE
ncbi:phage tail assembly chaperone [Oricola thermophila]|uniref:Phage tail assembly chaperone n=2 Tax=Oricola thermophila TaxID=2742145 RepID=A0A6N1VGD2_9HYPH|nr:phage tail assembly chaperone [Oricola thermophila]